MLKPKKGKLPPGEHDSTVSVQEAWLAARDSDEDVNFDDDAMNPHFSYLDEHGIRHDIWFLDAVTALITCGRRRPSASRHSPCGDWEARTVRCGGYGTCLAIPARPTN